MALEAVIVQQDPFIYGCKDYNYSNNSNNSIRSNNIAAYEYDELSLPLPFQEDHKPIAQNHLHNTTIISSSNNISGSNWDSPPPSSIAHATTISSPETCFFAGGSGSGSGCTAEKASLAIGIGRRKRRRVKPTKNKEEMENQRMTHIAVERNRRRQMNDYLAVLRSIMPPSYAQRGDQASIVGGAINFVKELEQLHQFLEAKNLSVQLQPSDNLFSNFFTFPQFSTCPSASTTAVDTAAEHRSSIADIEVMMVESHANIRLSTKRRPKQLLKLVARFQSIYLTILHLNITTVDQSVLYSFSVKVEDECKVSTVNEIATRVHDIVGMIEEESI